jgi:hypothetical protein
MVLTPKQEQRIKEMPIIETRITKSKDGKYLLHRTTMTTIRPMSYYEAIIADNIRVEEDSLTEADLRAFLEAA